jgi:hypothetical protein
MRFRPPLFPAEMRFKKGALHPGMMQLDYHIIVEKACQRFICPGNGDFLIRRSLHMDNHVARLAHNDGGTDRQGQKQTESFHRDKLN